MSNYYEILQIEKTATQNEIKQSYKRLAKIHHPDKGGDTEVFQKLQVAYETLSDEDKRRQYDNPMPDMSNIMHPGNMFFNMSDFGFGFGNRIKKSNHQHKIKISLEDVFRGIKKSLNIKFEIKCENCIKTCDVCNGSCKIRKVIQLGMMQILQEQPCLKCIGSGKIKISELCSSCNNKGSVLNQQRIDINIPKGVTNNKVFVFEGLGEQPTLNNEIPGDLLVNIEIDKHPHFIRNNLDLIYEQPITFKETMIGKEVTIPHFEGKLFVNTRDYGIVDPSKQYIIEKKGLTDDRHIGNIILKFNVDYNIKLTNEQLKVINETL